MPFHLPRKWPACAFVAFVGLLLNAMAATPSSAATCSVTASAVNFGNLAIGSLTGATTSGTVKEGCTGGWTTGGNLTICNAIGNGNNDTGTTRTMTLVQGGVTYAIPYQLYTNAARTTVYAYPGSDVFYVPYTTANGGSTTTNTYAKILTAPGTLAPGTYVDTYTSVAEAVATFDTWNTIHPPVTCGANANYTEVAILFTVQVTIPSSCMIAAGPLNFGTTSVITGAINATSTISVTCTNLALYNVALSAGTATGATVTTRKMTGLGGATIAYSLYQNAGRTTNWGNTVNVDTEPGTGTGSAQTVTVYGQVPPQPPTRVGAYSDTIVATLWY